MTIDHAEIIRAVSELAKDKNVQVTVKESTKGAVVCGVCCFVGGLLLGPGGLAIGGTAGSFLAYNMAKNNFRSLRDVIINDLSQAQKERLVQHILNAVADAQPIDFIMMLLPLIQSDPIMKVKVLKAIIDFISSETNMKIID